MADPFAAWCRLRETGGRRVTVIDLYAMAGQERGLEPHELPVEERRELAYRAMAVILPGWELTGQSARAPEPIEIVSYDPEWPIRFDAWRQTLSAVLGDTPARIEHVGSTAVPGLAAKPIVDIQVSVDDPHDEPRYVPKFEAAGVQLRSRDSDHRYFRPFPDRPRDVHVHVCAFGSGWEREHLLFREYLRRHPEARDAYAAMKHATAARWFDDRIAYTEAKTGLILETLDAAETWAQSVGWTVALSCSR